MVIPLARMGFMVSATVYSWNTSSLVPFRVETAKLATSNTSHGPVKSMMTVFSEITKATGILAWSGGLRGFAMAAGSSPALGPELAVGAEAAKSLLGNEKGNTAIVPKIAELVRNSLLFMFILSVSFCSVAVDCGDLVAAPVASPSCLSRREGRLLRRRESASVHSRSDPEPPLKSTAETIGTAKSDRIRNTFDCA